jgi:NADPH:quinone reductase-like Zn-dependent oxidoreductase
MRVAGIHEVDGPVEVIELPEPRPLAGDEVLIEVRAAGVGNWDEIIRTGGWDVGSKPPMALGVEAAGIVTAVGQAVDQWTPGDQVMTHPLPLREQGTWAQSLIAPAALLARKPSGVSLEAAGVFPVPALTAEQVVVEALKVKAGEQLLVSGAGGVTGSMLVSLAALRDADVIATASPSSQQRVSALAASHVIDYHDERWPEQVLELTGGTGVEAAANAAPGGAASALRAVADGGRLATITSDAPDEQRGITVSTVYVRPDGAQLQRLAELLESGRVEVPVAATYRIADAAQALTAAAGGHAGGAIVLTL